MLPGETENAKENPFRKTGFMTRSIHLPNLGHSSQNCANFLRKLTRLLTELRYNCRIKLDHNFPHNETPGTADILIQILLCFSYETALLKKHTFIVSLNLHITGLNCTSFYRSPKTVHHKIIRGFIAP